MTGAKDKKGPGTGADSARGSETGSGAVGMAPRGRAAEDLAQLVEQVFADFIADPERNNLGPDYPLPAWEGFLLGFARGDDPLWDEMKQAAGPQHWTPAEAFAAARAVTADDGKVISRGKAMPADPAAAALAPRAAAAEADDVLPDIADPTELTVISWALCQTEATKAANRLETRMPSEPWARARVYGQDANRGLHLALLEALSAAGYEAVAPTMLPGWMEVGRSSNSWASSWSERHVAYVSGLGTFGLSGGLITVKGQAVRFGSVIVRAAISATPRPYDGPFAYCLELSGGSCAVCADRCPAGSVSVDGRDKEACAQHLDRGEKYVKQAYGFAGYGCGLCQTAVPCESGIPEGLAPARD